MNTIFRFILNITFYKKVPAILDYIPLIGD